jgi:hypothetical protein
MKQHGVRVNKPTMLRDLLPSREESLKELANLRASGPSPGVVATAMARNKLERNPSLYTYKNRFNEFDENNTISSPPKSNLRTTIKDKLASIINRSQDYGKAKFDYRTPGIQGPRMVEEFTDERLFPKTGQQTPMLNMSLQMSKQGINMLSHPSLLTPDNAPHIGFMHNKGKKIG